MIPDATVKAELGRLPEVTITSGKGVVVWRGPQRNLYRKYGWPAQKDIQGRLQMYIEEFLEADA